MSQRINEINTEYYYLQYSIAGTLHCCSVVVVVVFFSTILVCMLFLLTSSQCLYVLFSLSIWHRHDFHFIHSFIKIHFNYPYYFCVCIRICMHDFIVFVIVFFNVHCFAADDSGPAIVHNNNKIIYENDHYLSLTLLPGSDFLCKRARLRAVAHVCVCMHCMHIVFFL